MATSTQPVLGAYTDYRLYLKDFYEFKRESGAVGLRKYTYAHFSAAADIKSPNYLKLIIEGQRNLSDEMVLKFAKALRLDREDTTEFLALVRYNQAIEPLERNRYLKELSEFRAKRALADGSIAPEAWNKVPTWLGWVLYAMADQENVQFSLDQLKQLFRSRVDAADLKLALQKLLDSGELQLDPETGEVKKPRELVESPQDLPVSLIRNLQAELIYLGIESLFRDSPKEREFGSLTLALTPNEFEQLRFELRQLRKKFHKDISVKRKLSKGERVYQMNIQLFPVTDAVQAPALNPMQSQTAPYVQEAETASAKTDELRLEL